MKVGRTPRIVAALLLLASVGLWAQGPLRATQAAAGDPRFDRLVAAVETKMKELGVPGVAVGVLSDGTVRTKAFGVTNVDHPLPVTDDTLFQIGSISKTFTGTAVMRLVEQGKLSLDDPTRRHLPAFSVQDADASARATIRDTLTHMGGWEGDFFDDPSNGDDALERRPRARAARPRRRGSGRDAVAHDSRHWLLTATALVGTVGHIHPFRRALQFASRIGLTRREHSSGGSRRLGGISKRADLYLRCLLTHGARAVLITAQRQPRTRPIAPGARRRHDDWLAGGRLSKLARWMTASTYRQEVRPQRTRRTHAQLLA